MPRCNRHGPRPWGTQPYENASNPLLPGAGPPVTAADSRAAGMIRRAGQFATSATAAVILGIAATNILRIFSSVTLTRLLDSYAYGVVGVITSVAFTVAMLADVGIFSFIVRHQEGDDEHFLNQLWTIRFLRGVVLMVSMLVLSWPVAMALGKPELEPVIAVWSISFLIEGASSLAFATGARNRLVWRLTTMDLLSSVFMLCCSVALGLLWRNYWALVAGMLLGATAKTVLSYTLFHSSGRQWHFSRERFAELWDFSRFILMSSSLTLFVVQADKIVLARMMPLDVFGFYAIASTLAIAPVALSTAYATRVFLPAYSEAVRDNRPDLKHIFYHYRRKFTLLYLLGAGGLIGGAPMLIALLYDPRYHPVGPYLSILAISGALMAIVETSRQGLIAHGKTQATFNANLWSAVWLVTGGIISFALGSVMLFVVTAGTLQLPVVISQWWSMRRLGVFSVRQEAYGIVALALGIGLGWAASTAMLTLFPKL